MSCCHSTAADPSAVTELPDEEISVGTAANRGLTSISAPNPERRLPELNRAKIIDIGTRSRVT
jgi:hypothetical protein